MPTLRQSLENLPHRDLRGIATRLNVRRRDEHHKEAWIAAICQAWRDPDRQHQIIAGLSAAAYQAARRLALSGDLPAALFLAEYGPVRRPRPGQSWSPPPWAEPATIGEELYYAGLLAAADDAPLEKAGRLALPADLASLFQEPAEAAAVATLQPTADAAAPLILLHDVAQTLCFLAEAAATGHLSLLHGRWLPPAALADLNRRLLRGQPALPRAHARNRWLRFLFFLAAAAGLQQAGRLTPSGWTWLAEPDHLRLAHLWDAWRIAPVALRQAYRQPTAELPAPWPDLVLKHLAGLPSPFTAEQAAQVVLGQEHGYTAYFAAHLADLDDLDAAVAALLDSLAADWGLLARATTADGPVFALTAPGRWLLAGAQGDPPALIPPEPTSPTAVLDASADQGWRLHVSPWAPPIHLARLAPYVRYEARTEDGPEGCPPDPRPPSPPILGGTGGRGTENRPPDPRPPDPPILGGTGGRGTGGLGARHTYRLDADAVAAAAAAGYGLPDLLAGLADLGIRLDPAQLAALQAWHAAGRLLEIVQLPLLRAADRQTMARILEHPAVRAGLGDLLSPTAAIIAIPPAALADRLRAAGFFPQSPTPDPQPLTPNPQPPTPAPRASAALWLAGRLYAALGDVMPLPLPPPFPELTALLESLSPADRAAVQAQWETLRDALRAALDGQTYAPPPQPTDPNRWRPAIAAAIAEGRSITIRYFTAGRNVLTERTVTPYWIEEARGIPYLRGECHLTGQVRLFRLDRIQHLTPSPTPSPDASAPGPG